MDLDVKLILRAISNYKPARPLDLIHIGQRQMSMILDYISQLEIEIENLKNKNDFLMSRDNKLQLIEQIVKETIDNKQKEEE